MNIRRVLTSVATAALTCASLATPNAAALSGGYNAQRNPTTDAILQSVSLENSMNCTGTMISTTWAIFAKHCVGNNNGIGLATAGVDLLGQKQVIRGMYVHPEADIALVKLAAPLNIRPVPLATSAPAQGTKGHFYGWGGKIALGHTTLTQADVVVNGVKPNQAGLDRIGVTTYGNAKFVPGDSGGPFIADGKLQGILSTSSIQGTYGSTQGWFFPVADYRSWIDYTMNTIDARDQQLSSGISS